jgi:hypothetical protein
MNDGNYVFSQLMSLIYRQAFARIVEKYNTPPLQKIKNKNSSKKEGRELRDIFVSD